MLDIKYVRENLEKVKKAVAKRGTEIDWEKLLTLDEEKRALQGRVELLRAEQNKLAKLGKEADREKAKEIKEMLKDLDSQLIDAAHALYDAAVQLPNIPLSDVPTGKNSDDNVVVKTVGKVEVKTGNDHIELGTKLDIIDIDRATKVSGSRFYYLKNEAAELEFALIRYVLDVVKKDKFQPIIPPILINEDMAWGSGHFEAINDDAYHMRNDALVAVGTSEQSILPYHAGEIIESLPQRYVGFSTCLRREAGSHGKDVRGILRVHQFDKIEMFSYVRPEDSEKEHDLIVGLEEEIMNGLKLPYRVVNLCAGDLGLPSAKTIDIETWMPSQRVYRETHSSSNCTDFQARRLDIKYKTKDGKSEFVHTLNGTGIAVARTLIAILENYQQADGSIEVPKVLQKYVDFKVIKNANNSQDKKR